MGPGGDERRVHSDRLRKQRRASESGSNAGVCRAGCKFHEVCAVSCGTNAWRICRSSDRLAALPAALEGNFGRGDKAGLLLYHSRHPQSDSEPAERNHRHVRAGVRCRRHLFEERGRRGTGGGARALSGREPGLGHRPLARRNDRLRHQSRARLWTAPRARDSARRGKGRLGLGLCLDSHRGAAPRGRACRMAAARAGRELKRRNHFCGADAISLARGVAESLAARACHALFVCAPQCFAIHAGRNAGRHCCGRPGTEQPEHSRGLHASRRKHPRRRRSGASDAALPGSASPEPRAGLGTEISVKLTQLGLDLSPELCLEKLRRILAAERPESTVWIDMEASNYVDATLELYRRLLESCPNAGICLQAYLYRTKKDLDELLKLRPSVRLVKGAYKEPANVAFPRKADVDENYFALAQTMLHAKREGRMPRAAFGTHDLALIRRITDFAAREGFAKSDVEVQMLYGIQRAEQARLAHDGYRSAVLVSYGDFWYPWFVRRLAERPANVWFLIKNAFVR